MDPVIYNDPEVYILSGKTQIERIERLGQIIDALQITMIKAAATGNIEEYSLDTGQTKVKTLYRDTTTIANTIVLFERMQQSMIARLNNQMNGHVIRLVDSKNFRG